MWDIGDDLEDRQVLPNTEGTINFLEVSQDQKTLLTVGCPAKSVFDDLRQTIRIWDLSGDQPRCRAVLKREQQNGFLEIAFASQGTAFVDADGPDETPLRVWDITKDPPKVRCLVKARQFGNSESMALSPDGKLLAVDARSKPYNHRVMGRFGPEAKGLDTFEGTPFTLVKFTPDGNLLVSSGWDRVLRPFWPATDAGRKCRPCRGAKPTPRTHSTSSPVRWPSPATGKRWSSEVRTASSTCGTWRERRNASLRKATPAP